MAHRACHTARRRARRARRHFFSRSSHTQVERSPDQTPREEIANEKTLVLAASFTALLAMVSHA